ncbi:BRO family protein [Kitasatospora sp. NPDC005856]|uniref:phage antirepressor n=1 Tax=Kitasatospora sp. NPDC005856 TaxID=3154566 RepID=UPI00340A7C49
MSSIIPYTFPETATAVRVTVINSEPWFVAADVAMVLDLGNPRSSLALLDDDEKGVHTMDTPGGPQQMVTVSEAGLYSLILRSRKPQAKAFKRWITHEVIPSIRRTGSYAVAPVVPMLPSPRELAALVIAEADRADAAEARVLELEPKALAHDTYLSVGSGDRLVREVAKLLGWRQQDLRQFLIAERLIFARPSGCGSMQWDFYAGHERHFRSAEHVVEHRSIGLCSHYTLHVRPAGVDLIQRRIAKRQAERDAIGGAA